jgi:hypothetical protein
MKRNLMPYVWITVFGLFLVGLAWFIYVGIYLTIEAVWFQDNPQGFPADTLRRMTSLTLLLLYIVTLNFYKKPVLKAVLLVPATSMFMITIILSYYDRLIIGIPVLMIFVFVIMAILYKLKARNYDYYALIYALVLSLLYAWPR